MFKYLLLVLQVSAIWPTIPVYKEEAYEMFGGRYIKYISPFTQDRYESARWNYIERNLDNHLSRNVGAPMVHLPDHRGNFLRLEKMHVGQSICSFNTVPADTDVTKNGLVSVILGFIYGL